MRDTYSEWELMASTPMCGITTGITGNYALFMGSMTDIKHITLSSNNKLLSARYQNNSPSRPLVQRVIINGRRPLLTEKFPQV